MPPTDRDESRFAQASKQMLESGDYVNIRFQDQDRLRKPVGIYWLQSISAALTGEPAAIWSYRLPSLLAAIAAVLLTFYLGQRLFGYTQAIVAALLLASCLLLGLEARLAKTDAVLLACIVISQIVLADLYLRYLQPQGGNSQNEAATTPTVWPHAWWIFWLAQGLGLLVKGPVAGLISGLTVVALVAVDRQWQWLRPLRAARGILILAVLTAPWLIAISLATDGAFWQASLSGDMLAKVASAQESHGAPIGSYALMFPLTFWPGSVWVLLAIPWVWRHRTEAAVRFCLAWIVPTWLFFELLPTKLPHYVLPTFPAIALLTGAAWWADDRPRWPQTYWRWPLGLIWGIPSLTLALLPVILPLLLKLPVTMIGGVTSAVLVAAAGMIIYALRGNQRQWVMIAGLVGGLGLSVGFFGNIMPQLTPLWISRTVSEIRGEKSTDLVSVGYAEPSLVFLLGKNTYLTGNGRNGAEYLIKHKGEQALVRRDQVPVFLDTLAESGWQAREQTVINGLNYNKGNWVELVLFNCSALPP